MTRSASNRSAFDILFDAAMGDRRRPRTPRDRDAHFAATLEQAEQEARELPSDVRLDIAIGLDAAGARPPRPPRDQLFDAALRAAAQPIVPPVADLRQAVTQKLEQDAAAEENIKRVAAGTEHIVHQPIRNNWRDWEIGFGAVFGPAGAESTVTVRPQCLFKSEKVMATDSASTPGTGSRIVRVAIGNHYQRPGGDNGTLTSMFAPTGRANGVSFDTSQEWSSISITVSFVQTCTFEITLFGKALLP